MVERELGLPLAVHAFSTLRPTDLAGSAYPAVVLSLRASNPAGAAAARNVSFMLAMPMAAWRWLDAT